jgi:hypothetical protein
MRVVGMVGADDSMGAWNAIMTLLFILLLAACGPRPPEPATPGSASERGARIVARIATLAAEVEAGAARIEALSDPTGEPPTVQEAAVIREEMTNLEALQVRIDAQVSELKALARIPEAGGPREGPVDAGPSLRLAAEPGEAPEAAPERAAP